MAEGISDLEPIKILLFVVPGAVFAIVRSFAVRGFFPKLSKDDLGALAISSCVYGLFVRLAGTDFLAHGIWDRRPMTFWILVLFLIPAAIGFVSGTMEASDLIGRMLRACGLRFPSPEPNAWETMFREMPAESLLMVILADDSFVCGRWVRGSVSSQNTETRDLYLSEIGSMSSSGDYISYIPRRGIYFCSGEIKRIEVINDPQVNI